jgi:hypothetical protein
MDICAKRFELSQGHCSVVQMLVEAPGFSQED